MRAGTSRRQRRRTIAGLVTAAVLLAAVPLAWGNPAEVARRIAAVWSEAPRPRLPVPPVTSPPIINGILDDPAWRQASITTPFIRTPATPGLANWGVDPAEAQTVVHLIQDREHLYIGVRLDEPLMDQVVAAASGRDDDVWLDDCFECYMEVGDVKPVVVQWIINSRNVVWDSHDGEGGAKWDMPGLRTAVSKEASAWVVEAAIPLASVGIDPQQVGRAWRVNFCRERYAAKTQNLRENSTWAGQPEATFRMPARFGELVLAPAAVRKTELPTLTWGPAQAAVEVLTGIPSPPLAFGLHSNAADLSFAPDVGTQVVEGMTATRAQWHWTDHRENAQVVWIEVRRGEDLLAVVRRTGYLPPVISTLKEREAEIRAGLVIARPQTRYRVALERVLEKVRDLRARADSVLQRLTSAGAEASAADRELWHQLWTEVQKLKTPAAPPPLVLSPQL